MAAPSPPRYPEDAARCAEILRMALPQMARQAAGAHPIAYAVWFEHLSGRNPRLSEALLALTQGGKVLDEAATARLYRDHVAELDERAALEVTDGIRRVIVDIAQSASAAEDQTDRFGHSLDQLAGQADCAAADHPADAEVLTDVLVQTRVMREAVGQLRGKLDASQREIEQLRSEVDRARIEALVDGLTGLPNRRAFEQLTTDAAGRAAAPVCLIVGDIDHFKRINDTYGHLFGDTVLKVVAQALKRCVCEPSTAARVGGEEFAILARGLEIEAARALAEHVRATVAGSRIKRRDSHEPIGQVTLSFGVAAYCAGEDADAWFERADRALYQSKAGGRNRVTLADGRGAPEPGPASIA